MAKKQQSLWNEFDKVQPESWGYYLVSNGNPRAVYHLPYFQNNFYRNGWYHSYQSDTENELHFRGHKSSKFKYWMETPEFPPAPAKKFSELLWFCSENQIKLLNSIGVNSIESLLSKDKKDLYAIKGFKDSAFSRVLECVYHLDLPASWGTDKEITDIVSSGRRKVFIKGCLDIDYMEVEKFYCSWPSHKYDKHDHCLKIETKSLHMQSILIDHHLFKACYSNKRGIDYYFNLDDKCHSFIKEQMHKFNVRYP